MARARNIKPAFFKNEALAELPYEYRLLFVGLWTLADREGKLEDRPRRIKMELFPADDVKVDAALNKLAAHGFIERYEAQGVKVVRVNNFLKHQNPHPREKAMGLPEPAAAFHGSGCTKVEAGKGQGCGRQQAGPADILNPDILNPDSLNPAGKALAVTRVFEKHSSGVKEPSGEKQKKDQGRKTLPEDFALTPASKNYALERGIDTDDEVQTFCNYHTAKGSSMLDWQAAWRAWCNNAVRFGKASSTSTLTRTNGSKADANATVFKQSAIEQRNKATLERLLHKGVPDEA